MLTGEKEEKARLDLELFHSVQIAGKDINI